MSPQSRTIDGLLARAEAVCRQRRARLTPLRRRVLTLVLETQRPVGAYELLERLAAEGRSGAPPTVYRALDFLQAHGLVHRVASANAYVACNHACEGRYGLMFVCRRCGRAVELEARRIDAGIGRCAASLGFRVPNQALEVVGTCADCDRGVEA